MRRPLDQQVRDLVEHQHLSDAQWRRLQAVQARLQDAPRADRTSHRRTWAQAAAAALVFAVLGFLAGVQLTTSPLEAVDLAAEVSRNHAKQEPMEVTSTDLGDLRRHFAELEFPLLASNRVNDLEWRLEGGRYCSLGGRPAAQLRLVERATGRTQTLYQARYDPERFPHLPHLEAGAPPLSLVVGDTPVRLWVERGVLFAVTAD